MDTVTLADARSRLEELVDRALECEPVRISRGEKVVELVALAEPAAELVPKPRFDFAALRRLTDGMTPSTMDSVELIRLMREEERY